MSKDDFIINSLLHRVLPLNFSCKFVVSIQLLEAKRVRLYSFYVYFLISNDDDGAGKEEEILPSLLCK